MCDFDELCGDEGFCDGLDDDPEDNLESRCGQGFEDQREGLWGLEMADFALIGGALGYLEEEIEDRERMERKMAKEEDDDMGEGLILPDPEELIP